MKYSILSIGYTKKQVGNTWVRKLDSCYSLQFNLIESMAIVYLLGEVRRWLTITRGWSLRGHGTPSQTQLRRLVLSDTPSPRVRIVFPSVDEGRTIRYQLYVMREMYPTLRGAARLEFLMGGEEN